MNNSETRFEKPTYFKFTPDPSGYMYDVNDVHGMNRTNDAT